ncbi:MAG: carboxyltransferase domain-containing protein, partial [Flavobacteriaceae bacterium]
MTPYSLSIRPFGKHAVLLEWPNRVEEAILYDILQFYSHLKDNCLKDSGWEMIPAYNSLTLVHNLKQVDFES